MNQRTGSNWFSSSIHTDEGYTPSLRTGDGSITSHSKQLAKDKNSDVSLGVWRAPPGVYFHSGSTTGETFVVVDGKADIEIGDSGSIPIEPGTLISIKPNTPSRMTVHALLHKVALNFG